MMLARFDELIYLSAGLSMVARRRAARSSWPS
jgi:hypothetical protein